jgi:hypothetical protein
MRVSFDLDGVITDGRAHEFFVEMENTLPSNQWPAAKHHFYSSRNLRCSPYTLMNDGDIGFIVTSRQPDSQQLTRDWLRNRKITLPVLFADPLGLINWSNYPEASADAALRKASIIQHLQVQLHYDNNPYIVTTLRKLLPGLKCILVEDK